VTSPKKPSAVETEQVVEALLAAGYSRMPLRVPGTPVPQDHRDRKHISVWLDGDGGFRLWSAALHVRTLDAFRATLLLAREVLDADARAHLRIGFDHMLAFAWIAAEPDDLARPIRIARYGFNFSEKQLMEMLKHDPDPMRHVDDLALILETKDKVESPPNIREMCAELDRVWVPRLPGLRADSTACFSYWYSHLFRGASAFIHPTSRGIDPVSWTEDDAFLVGPAREVPVGVVHSWRCLQACTSASPRSRRPGWWTLTHWRSSGPSWTHSSASRFEIPYVG